MDTGIDGYTFWRMVLQGIGIAVAFTVLVTLGVMLYVKGDRHGD